VVRAGEVRRESESVGITMKTRGKNQTKNCQLRENRVCEDYSSLERRERWGWREQEEGEGCDGSVSRSAGDAPAPRISRGKRRSALHGKNERIQGRRKPKGALQREKGKRLSAGLKEGGGNC